MSIGKRCGTLNVVIVSTNKQRSGSIRNVTSSWVSECRCVNEVEAVGLTLYRSVSLHKPHSSAARTSS